jgi:hypothetical protein
MTNEQSDADFLRELAHYTSTLSHENEARVRRIADLLDTFALEPTRDAEDAARYRCLRSLPAGSWIDLEYSGQPLGGEELDRRVDEAMAQVNRTPPHE